MSSKIEDIIRITSNNDKILALRKLFIENENISDEELTLKIISFLHPFETEDSTTSIEIVQVSTLRFRTPEVQKTIKITINDNEILISKNDIIIRFNLSGLQIKIVQNDYKRTVSVVKNNLVFPLIDFLKEYKIFMCSDIRKWTEEDLTMIILCIR